jgi:hypothetical protein
VAAVREGAGGGGFDCVFEFGAVGEPGKELGEPGRRTSLAA